MIMLFSFFGAMTYKTFQLILAGWILFGLIIFVVLLFIPAPYGRHTRKGWGPMIPNRLGWIIMELPSLLAFSLFFLFGGDRQVGIVWIFFALYVAHYINRSLIYPFRTRTSGKKMPLIIAFFAIFFNLVNGSTNGIYFASFSNSYPIEWLYDARFIIGALFFATGVIINVRSDRYLLRLRKNAKNGYEIPQGGLFKYVSCPNFLGEMLEWTGFAIMTWSPAALAFALWTIFNLVPRAYEHHRWYRKTFPDYPAERKAFIPYVL